MSLMRLSDLLCFRCAGVWTRENLLNRLRERLVDPFVPKLLRILGQRQDVADTVPALLSGAFF
jgi:hypothetical protein